MACLLYLYACSLMLSSVASSRRSFGFLCLISFFFFPSLLVVTLVVFIPLSFFFPFTLHEQANVLLFPPVNEGSCASLTLSLLFPSFSFHCPSFSFHCLSLSVPLPLLFVCLASPSPSPHYIHTPFVCLGLYFSCMLLGLLAALFCGTIGLALGST